MTIASDIDLTASREGVRDHARRAGQALRDMTAEAGAKARRRLNDAGGRSSELALRTGRQLKGAGLMTAAAARRRPGRFGLAAVIGVAAIALLASPRLRTKVADGGARLWNEAQKRRGLLRL